MRLGKAAALAVLCSGSALAQGIDPLDAQVELDDARRFADVFARTNGAPTAEDLESGYLNGAGRGVEVFTPYRIQNGENLAAAVARNTEHYQRGIDVCLPIAEDMSSELRAVYLGLQGLYPDAELPRIYAVFGANNSGGTAGATEQVLGLEVICRIAETEEDIRATFRAFFAHETVHVLQTSGGWAVAQKDPLLAQTLIEGMADYVAELVTGRSINPERDEWGEANEAMLWAAFQKDRAIINAGVARGETFQDQSPESSAAFRRWHGNAGSPPEGWHGEAGYWVGAQIIAAYVERADNRREALEELLVITDPVKVLEMSGYAEKFAN